MPHFNKQPLVNAYNQPTSKSQLINFKSQQTSLKTHQSKWKNQQINFKEEEANSGLNPTKTNGAKCPTTTTWITNTKPNNWTLCRKHSLTLINTWMNILIKPTLIKLTLITQKSRMFLRGHINMRISMVIWILEEELGYLPNGRNIAMITPEVHFLCIPNDQPYLIILHSLYHYLIWSYISNPYIYYFISTYYPF